MDDYGQKVDYQNWKVNDRPTDVRSCEGEVLRNTPRIRVLTTLKGPGRRVREGWRPDRRESSELRGSDRGPVKIEKEDEKYVKQNDGFRSIRQAFRNTSPCDARKESSRS